MNGSQRAAPPGARQKFYFQFITTYTADTPGTALLLHFDDQRYIFGHVAEGTQRACIQRGVGLRKAHNIFMTGETKWQQNGGLIGLILTLADVQQAEATDTGSEVRPRLNIYGGPKLLHLMACARRFVFRTGMPLSINEAVASDNQSLIQEVYVDKNVRVLGLPLRGSKSEQASPKITIEDPQSDSDDPLRPGNENVVAEQDLRRNIVTNMFDSDWRRDRLVESPFKDVKLPATVWIRDPVTKDLGTFNCLNRESTPQLSPDTLVLSRNPWPASLVGEMPSASNLPKRVSMSYIVKGQPQRGVFDPKKAKACGVQPGPDFTKLTMGQSITVDERVVTPEMVLGPPRTGKGIAIFDLPNRNHLYDLERQMQTWSPDVMEGVEAVVWMIDHTVPEELFQRVCKPMGNVKHIISHKTLSPNYLALESSAKTAFNLSQISPEHFPPLIHDNVNGCRHDQGVTLKDATKDNEYSFGNSGLPSAPIRAQRGLQFKFQPDLVLDETEIPSLLDLKTYANPTVGQAKQLLATNIPHQAKNNASIEANLEEVEDLNEPEIIALGTGSAVPSKYRNVSATLLRMPHGMGNYLFDCGENTLGQLRRVFKPQDLDKLLLDLRVIWISHLHADHHLGTISVLQERKAVQARKAQVNGLSSDGSKDLAIMSEVNMIDFLDDYRSVEKVLSPRLSVYPAVCNPISGVTYDGKVFDFEKHGLPIQKVETVRVSHCHGAQAISMTFKNGFKFSYSGDCRPSTAFTEIGANSDVLVHEATFEDDKAGDAMAKKHSTTGEALGVAMQMKAKNVILTHFSQRYQKVPVLSNIKLPTEVQFEEDDQVDDPSMPPIPVEEDRHVTTIQSTSEPAAIPTNSNKLPPIPSNQSPNICIAFDYMRVKVSQIASMRSTNLFAAIEKMFDLQREQSDREREVFVEKENEIKERKRIDKQVKAERIDRQMHKKKDKKKDTTQVNDKDPQKPHRPPSHEKSFLQDIIDHSAEEKSVMKTKKLKTHHHQS